MQLGNGAGHGRGMGARPARGQPRDRPGAREAASAGAEVHRVCRDVTAARGTGGRRALGAHSSPNRTAGSASRGCGRQAAGGAGGCGRRRRRALDRWRRRPTAEPSGRKGRGGRGEGDGKTRGSRESGYGRVEDLISPWARLIVGAIVKFGL